MSLCNHFAHASRTRFGGWIKWRTKQRELELFAAIKPDRAARILEIGPGKGELAELLRRAGYQHYRGAEPNQAMRTELNQRGFSVVDYQIPALQEPDQSADAIILCDVFEHLNGAHDAARFIQEAQRVLSPQGVLCIACPDYLHWKEDFYNCDYTHNNLTTVRRVQQQLYGAGFEDLGYTYFSAHLTGMSASLLSWVARIGLAFAGSNGNNMKFYKAKLTMLRRFWIAGRQPI